MKKSIFLIMILFGCANILLAQSSKKLKLVAATNQTAQPLEDGTSKKEAEKKKDEAKQALDKKRQMKSNETKISKATNL